MAYLPWGLHLWDAHRNPFFPYFNNIFQSPDLPPESWADVRFRPKTPIEALLVPIRLLTTSTTYSELPARDPRLLLGLIACIAASWPSRDAPAYATRSTRMVVAFFLVSYVLWMLQYGILRYTATLEVVSAVLLLTALARLPARAYQAAAVATAITVVAFTVRPDWGRRDFDRHFLAADWPTLSADAMVLTSSGAPLAFFVLGLPARVPVIAITNNVMNPTRCNALQARAEARIRTHSGTLWLLEEDLQHPDIERGRTLADEHYGLRVSGDCSPMRSTFGALRLCPMEREPRQARCSR